MPKKSTLMGTTIVADYLESVLLEIQYASDDIVNRAADPDASENDVEQSLLRALETARKVLEEALGVAQMNGVPKLAIEAA